jgi:hypothetical protein
LFLDNLDALLGTGGMDDLDVAELTALDRLRAIALARFVGHEHAKIILLELENQGARSNGSSGSGGGSGDAIGDAIGSGASPATSILALSGAKYLSATTCHHVRRYFYTKLLKEGGSAALDALVSQRATYLPWLQPEGVATASGAAPLVELAFDPFVASLDQFAKEAHSALGAALTYALVNGGEYADNQLAELGSLRPQQLIGLLFTAVNIELANGTFVAVLIAPILLF